MKYALLCCYAASRCPGSEMNTSMSIMEIESVELAQGDRNLVNKTYIFRSVICVEVDAEEEEYDCADRRIYECAYPGDIQKFHAVSSPEELVPLCRNLHDYLRCIDHFTRKCLEPPQRSHFNRLFSGTSMIIQEICSEGHYQTEFLKHAACMKHLHVELDVCAQTYHGKIEKIGNNHQIGNNICCPLREYMNCINDVVLLRCGEVAANFSRGFNERLFHAILTTHCVSEETDCNFFPNANGGPRKLPQEILLLLLAVTTCLIHFTSS
ncbi:hypothetical protein GE061_001388 [Apolygus lucorum]|uniref:DUF19 domain-containing protein n=1 Tax=Apolygus lucorum TaxID=248454 RepID=A0A8S9YE25_APOLU|nr:hypothetical protein GE061_001388 [Apolygus lucorum]